MIVPCSIVKPVTLKKGGKLVMKFDTETFDDVAENYENFNDKPLIAIITNHDGEFIKEPCSTENMEGLKDGGKLILGFDSKGMGSINKNYRKFRGKPIILDLRIDADKQREILSQISPEQRKMCFAIFKDIGVYVGDYNVESVKEQQKANFLQTFPNHDTFSLSNCKRELANEFITFLVAFCFIQGIPLRQSPREAFDSVDTYLYLCLRYEKCAICGKPSETHHWNAIGMGRDRRKYDDSDHRKIALCREHHTEVETIGRDTFAEKHHIYGVKFAA